MKQLNRLNLAYLNRQELNEREMNALKGGDDSSNVCYCHTEGANRAANAVYGYTITAGGTTTGCVCASEFCDATYSMQSTRALLGSGSK